VRVSEVRFHPGGLGEVLMGRHFPSLIVSQGMSLPGLDANEDMTKTLEGRFGTGVVHLGQHREQGAALHQRADRGTVMGALD